MYILIDKADKIGWIGKDLGIISEESGKSIYTLRSWAKKSEWFENIRYILFESEYLNSRRGGINEGNRKYFNK